MAGPESYTRDSISLRGAGVVRIAQPGKGARFNLDGLLLADFCRIKPWDRVMEPGAGTGIVSLLLAKKYPRSHIVAIEAQSMMAQYCRRNIAANGLEDRIALFEQDIRTLRKTLKTSTFDVIVANPPYRRTGTGRQSANSERLSSRHDRLGDLSVWLDLHIFLKNRSRYVMIFAADRLVELLESLRKQKLEPKRLRLVYPYRDKPASLALVEAVKSGGEALQILPPLIVHAAGGQYSDEVKQFYALS